MAGNSGGCYGRTPGVLGERVIRRLIKQLSETITKNMPLDKRREVLKHIMSLREELQAGALINKEHYRKRKAAKQAKEANTGDKPAEPT